MPRSVNPIQGVFDTDTGRLIGVLPEGTSRDVTYLPGFDDAARAAAVPPLVSGAWNLATSGAWRPAALGALPRFSVSGGALGGTWALSYRNAAGTVTSDPAETVAAGDTSVTPVFLDDATEIAVAITGTVTVEVK